MLPLASLATVVTVTLVTYQYSPTQVKSMEVKKRRASKAPQSQCSRVSTEAGILNSWIHRDLFIDFYFMQDLSLVGHSL